MSDESTRQHRTARCLVRGKYVRGVVQRVQQTREVAGAVLHDDEGDAVVHLVHAAATAPVCRG